MKTTCPGGALRSMEHVVRVARSYDTQTPRRWCSVETCGDHWHVVPRDGRGPFFDPIELNGACDAMRALPPSAWDAAYAAAVRVRAVRAVRAVKAPPDASAVIPRGVEFWRVYYGVPNVETETLVSNHNKASRAWAPKSVIAPRSEQRELAAYRRGVRAAVCAAVRWLIESLRGAGRAFDAALTAAAFDLIRRTDDAVLVAKRGSPLRGALYPVHALLDRRGMFGVREKWTTRTMKAEDLDHLRGNARVLVVAELGPGDLAALLAHEIAHAITLPVWQPANNHPPAFVELESLAARALASTSVTAARRAP
jgi:hypothetical protein